MTVSILSVFTYRGSGRCLNFFYNIYFGNCVPGAGGGVVEMTDVVVTVCTI